MQVHFNTEAGKYIFIPDTADEHLFLLDNPRLWRWMKGIGIDVRNEFDFKRIKRFMNKTYKFWVMTNRIFLKDHPMYLPNLEHFGY